MKGSAVPRHVCLVVVALSSLIAISLALLALPASAGNGSILQPAGKLYGVSYQGWLGRWVRWAFEPAAAASPEAHLADCSAGEQRDPHMWYLAASGGGRLSQTCTIPAGRSIFVPVAEAVDFATSSKDTFPGLTAVAKSANDETLVLRASVDGVPVTSLRSFAAGSGNLVLKLPKGNLFSVPAGPTRIVVFGFNLVVSGLSPGRHTIVTYQESPLPKHARFKAGMTYHITVK